MSIYSSLSLHELSALYFLSLPHAFPLSFTICITHGHMETHLQVAKYFRFAICSTSPGLLQYSSSWVATFRLSLLTFSYTAAREIFFSLIIKSDHIILLLKILWWLPTVLRTQLSTLTLASSPRWSALSSPPLSYLLSSLCSNSPGLHNLLSFLPSNPRTHCSFWSLGSLKSFFIGLTPSCTSGITLSSTFSGKTLGPIALLQW